MIRRILSLIRRKLVHLWMYMCRIFPVTPRKIVVMSYYGGGFGDNGKAIVLRLLENRQDLDIVWVGRPDTAASIPEPLRYVRFRSPAYYYELATARVWIDNSRKASDIIKRKGQFYLQTWHGSVAMKRIEQDAAGSLARGYLEDAKRDSGMADVILSGSGFFTRLVRRAFWYSGEILQCGTPRLDALLRMTGEQKAKVRKKLGIPEGKRIVLYVPTFRADGNTDCYLRNYADILTALHLRSGKDWVFVLRLHPNVARRADFATFSDTVIDATSFPDLYELLPAADWVISDYSSVMFEAGIAEKPVLLYAPDIESYTADRSFYFRFEDLPFPLARTDRELLESIASFDREAYLHRLRQFNTTLDYYENGTASDAAAGRILRVVSNGS